MSLEDRSILYVEDDVIIASEVGHVLSDLGFRDIRIAHDLCEARRILSTLRPDFALLDVSLGGGEQSLALGQELAGKGTRVVFITGYVKADFGEDFSDFHFLEKPLSTDEICEAFQ